METAISKLLLDLLLTGILASPPVGATATVAVTGQVTEKSGGVPLPGVTVKAIDGKGVAVESKVTQHDGYYALHLPPGRYAITFELDGLTPERVPVILELGVPRDLNVSLANTTVSETIQVTAQATMPATTTITIFEHVAQGFSRLDTIRALAWLSGLGGLEATPTTLHFNPEVTLAGATAPQAIATSGADEGPIRILAGALPAEYSGGSGGLVIDLSEHTIDNDLTVRGEAHLQPGSLRDDEERVAAPFGNRTRSAQRDLQLQAGLALIPEQVFALASYRNDREQTENRSTADAAGDADLAQHGLNAKLTTSSVFPLLNDLQAQVAVTKRTSRGFIGDYLGHLHGTPEVLTNRREEEHFAGALSADLRIGETIHGITGQIRKDTESFTPLSRTDAPQNRDVSLGFFARGGSGWSLDEAKSRAVGISTKSNMSIGHHELGFGFASDRRNLDHQSELSGGARIDVDGADTIIRETTLDGAPVAVRNDAIDRSLFAAYVQDRVPLGSRTTANFGARWQLQRAKRDDLRLQTRILLPRATVAYDVLANGRASAFASYSAYEEPLPDQELIGLLTAYGVATHTVSGREAFAPASIVDENLRPRSTGEMTLGYAQHLGRTFYFSTSYMRRELEDDIVIGQCATATTCIGNPARGVLRTIQSRNGESIEVPRPRRQSDVLRVQLEHHSDANPFQLSYVNGRHRGNTEPRLFPQTLFTTSPYTDFRQALGDFQRVSTDGPLHADRRHSVLLTGSTRWHPVRLNYVAYWKSGAPISRYGFSEVFGNYPYVLATRGSEGRTPSLYDVSISAEYYTEIGPFEVRLTGSVENALNTQRPVLVDERWSFREQDNGAVRPTNPSFGMAIFRTPPRSVTFGVRLTSAQR